jgi:hypothetical protein
VPSSSLPFSSTVSISTFTTCGGLADLRRNEGEGRGCVHPDDDGGARRILVDDHIVLGALAVDEVDLHEFALMHHQRRIGLAVDVAADADIDHSSARDARLQGEDGGVMVGDRGCGGRAGAIGGRCCRLRGGCL